MKSTSDPQSATSLPRAPREASNARETRYLVMMGVRILCFILMVLVQPYGWYTWVFGAAAVFLPYIAVVLANVGQESKSPEPEAPAKAITAAHTPDAAEPAARVIRIEETRPIATHDASGRDADA